MSLWPLRMLMTCLALLAAAALAAPVVAQDAAEQEAAEQPAAESDEPAEDKPAAESDDPAEDEPPAADPAEPSADPADDDSSAAPGQADLDEATRRKLTATNGREIGTVIELLNSALEKGLDEGNEAFAKQMLASTLMERGQAVAGVLLDRPLPDPQQDPRWLQLRDVALGDLQKVVELDPTEYEGWLLIARLQQLPGGDAQQAEQALARVIDAEDADGELRAEAYVRRAAAREDNEAKLADLTGAVEAAPDEAEYRLMRARHHFATENFDAALADVDKAMELLPENYATHELRALVLLALERTEEALAEFDRATELAPDAITPYLRRSELYSQLGNMQQAIDQATKAIHRNEDSPLGYLMRAELYLRDDQPEQGLADAEHVLELQPGLVQAYWLKARAYDALGRTVEAMEQLEALVEGLPGESELNLQLELQIAAYALQLEMPRRAIASLNRALEIAPDDATLLRFRGDAYLNIGKHREAIADYRSALETAPDDSGVLNNLAWTLATSPMDDVRDGAEAVELATKACELTDYEQAHILSTLAAAYAETGNFDKAKEWAQKAVDLHDAENEAQIVEELQSYQRGEPWRELQQLDSGEREGAERSADRRADAESTDPDRPRASTPAPGRTIDF